MRTICKASLLTAAMLSLVSIGRATSNQTTATIPLTATISSFDNISCSTNSLDFGVGSAITSGGLTSAQEIQCTVASNDSTAVNVTAYLTSQLTGTTNSDNTIPSTAIEWSATSGGTYAAFAALTPGTNIPSNSVGAQIATGVAQSATQTTAVDFWLELNVPYNQPADSYTGTLTVAITPGS